MTDAVGKLMKEIHEKNTSTKKIILNRNNIIEKKLSRNFDTNIPEIKVKYNSPLQTQKNTI